MIKTQTKTRAFDVVNYLDSDEARAEYVLAAFEEARATGDHDFFLRGQGQGVDGVDGAGDGHGVGCCDGSLGGVRRRNCLGHFRSGWYVLGIPPKNLWVKSDDFAIWQRLLLKKAGFCRLEIRDATTYFGETAQIRRDF